VLETDIEAGGSLTLSFRIRVGNDFKVAFNRSLAFDACASFWAPFARARAIFETGHATYRLDPRNLIFDPRVTAHALAEL